MLIYRVKVATIARKLGITQAEIENYFVHPDIPFDIIKQARENEGSLINIENKHRKNSQIANPFNA
ncbi:hypothetical protein T260_08170 [Geobacillus thermopakistaniensis]|uniref:Uncharacterized protein n=1 Tax=Geobacillus thermopakistaniensis (strain MAS1) TaxID=1408282 RepID=A0A7U9JBF1_GEOTM|nr:hypothetical protein [Geobacillus sp. MAS1]ESU72421.1 hypothetical protein T260_08170 [Geobacillus sp. MAS1]